MLMEAQVAKRSCKERIRALRKELGLTKKECNRTPVSIHEPLPEIHVSMTKKQKKKMQKQIEWEKKKRELDRYRLADWWIHDYLREEYRASIYDLYDDFEEFVDQCYLQAVYYIDNFTYDPKTHVDLDWYEFEKLYFERKAKAEQEEKMKQELPGVDLNAPGTPVMLLDPDGDIPELYSQAFDLYCDDHPVKNMKQAKKRKAKFIKMVNKQYRKTYKNIDKDPTSTRWAAGMCVDPDVAFENMMRRSEEAAEMNQKIIHEMKKFFSDGMVHRQEEMMKHAYKRIVKMREDMVKRGLAYDYGPVPEYYPRD